MVLWFMVIFFKRDEEFEDIITDVPNAKEIGRMGTLSS